ncbi:hypothetical protein [Breoghania sp.]|uniref:hypothetical protein n=1 Tax=Breoghania sp. TaxID=2065378 RepID=UPI002633E57A|nr:hypothetical protein [Breoghania sp.]
MPEGIVLEDLADDLLIRRRQIHGGTEFHTPRRVVGRIEDAFEDLCVENLVCGKNCLSGASIMHHTLRNCSK